MPTSPSLFGNLANELSNPGAEIAKGIARGMQQRHLKELADDLTAREQMAKKYESIEQDDSYDADSRNLARDYAIQLRTLHPTDRLPKEFEEDKALAKHLGVGGFAASPAWIKVTRKKILKDGPTAPKEPAPPPDPTASSAAPSGPPPIGDPSGGGNPFMNLMRVGSAQNAQAPAHVDAGGGLPGGPTAGPPPVTAGGPTMAAAAAAPPPVAAPADAGPAPPPSIDEYVSTRMSPMEKAKQDAAVANVKNAIPDELADALGVPKGSSYKFAQEVRLKRQAESTAVMNESRAELEKAKALREQASIETDKTKAAAMAKAADAHMLAAQAAMEKATNPNTQSWGMPVVSVDEKGNVQNAWYPKTGAVVEAPPSVGRKTAVSEEERKSAGNMDDMLEREIPALRQLGEKYKDWLGPVAGTLMKAGTNWSDSLPPDVYQLVVKSANLTQERIYELSGKQINESEAKRLADVLTSPTSPYPKWIAALNELESKLKALRSTKAVPATTSEAPPPPPSIDSPAATSYKRTATDKATGHKIGSNDDWKTWYDVGTGKQLH